MARAEQLARTAVVAVGSILKKILGGHHGAALVYPHTDGDVSDAPCATGF
jgi:hypothetical protein